MTYLDDPVFQAVRTLRDPARCGPILDRALPAWRPEAASDVDVRVHYLNLIISGANTFAYDSSSGGQDEHMKVRMTDGYLRAISKGLAPEHSRGENVGCLYLDRNSIRALFREAQAILSAQGRGVWLASAVERAAREVRLRGIDVSDLPWVEIDFPEDLDIARRETWPAISLLPPRLAAASRSAVGIAQGVA